MIAIHVENLINDRGRKKGERIMEGDGGNKGMILIFVDGSVCEFGEDKGQSLLKLWL